MVQARSIGSYFGRFLIISLGVVASFVIAGCDPADDQSSTGEGVAPQGDGSASACKFLRDSEADFLPPNPGPSSAAEQQELTEIRTQLDAQKC